METKKILDAPCVFCGYNGKGYWQERTHKPLCPWHHIGGHDNRKRLTRHVVKRIYTQNERYQELLTLIEEMAVQFSVYPTVQGKKCRSAGGLSVLEEAYKELGWKDPHPLVERPITEQLQLF